MARDELDGPCPRPISSALDDAGFRKLFAGSPVKRLGHARFLRNVLIAIGNSGDAALLPAAEARLDDRRPDGARRGGLGGAAARSRTHAPSDDPDETVRAEWTAPVIH